MNIWRGEELFTDSGGNEITQSVKSRTEKITTGERAKFQNGKCSVLNI